VRQKWLAEQWSRAYNDWVSVYENHKDCPQTRNRHEHFRALRAANVCIGGYGLPDRLRLGRNPNGLAIPMVGIERTHTPVPMRRWDIQGRCCRSKKLHCILSALERLYNIMNT
jgi:hypothetical protein